MYFVPHFGHAKVYETSIWTPCFQILAKTMPGALYAVIDISWSEIDDELIIYQQKHLTFHERCQVQIRFEGCQKVTRDLW